MRNIGLISNDILYWLRVFFKKQRESVTFVYLRYNRWMKIFKVFEMRPKSQEMSRVIKFISQRSLKVIFMSS